MTGRALVSFIVPAYNEARLLGPTLVAIHAAARVVGEPYELIVVDDGSTDGTAGIAESHGARIVSVRVRQIARVRNAGARAAAGGTFIFVDADTIVSAATLQAAIDALARGAAGGGATVSFDGQVPLWGWLMLVVIRTVMRWGHMAAGCFVFCTRTAFEAAGGFDEGLYAAEEIALSRSLRREGPVVILRETVTTSGRKVRLHSFWDVVRLFADFLRQGTSVVRSPARLSIWYGERRDDPDVKT